MTYKSAKFEAAMLNGISLLTLTLGQGQTRNIAQYPLHIMTYESAKFETAMSNGIGGNA